MKEHAQPRTESVGHEAIETDVRAVWKTGFLLTGVLAAAFLLVFWLMCWFTAASAGSPADRLAQRAVKSNPQWNMPPQLLDLRTREQQVMSTYQWVDQSSGVACIPVDRALQIISEKGLPETIQAYATEAAARTQPPAVRGAADATADRKNE